MIHKILGFVILPALLTAFFASIIPRKLEERRQFNEAAKIFQDAFAPQLTFLKHNTNVGGIGSTDDISGLLRFGYVHYHLKAFEVFRSYLPARKRAAIDKAWEKYCNFAQYSDKNNEAKMKTLALDQIKKILKFAEHK